jgi:hypothetical protein
MNTVGRLLKISSYVYLMAGCGIGAGVLWLATSSVALDPAGTYLVMLLAACACFLASRWLSRFATRLGDQRGIVVASPRAAALS